MDFVTRSKAAFRKNVPDLQASLLGRYPTFVYRADAKPFDCPATPVFYFHEVATSSFEQKLIWLKENQYETLDTAEWLSDLKSPSRRFRKAVMLTFDDGHVSLFEAAFPLLSKYGYKAVSFVCPALVPSGEEKQPPKRRRLLCDWSPRCGGGVGPRPGGPPIAATAPQFTLPN